MPGTAPLVERMTIRIQLLGAFRVTIGSQTIEDAKWRRRKAGTLVKLLALAPDHRLHREQILDLIWPDLAPSQAANSFHQTLHLARQILFFCLGEAGVIIGSGGSGQPGVDYPLF